MKWIISILLLFPIFAISQTDTVDKWKFSGQFSLLLNQASFTNWASGGESSISGTTYLSLNSEYKNAGLEWVNNLNLGFGLMNSEEYDFYKKTEDKIDFQTKMSHRLNNRFSATLLGNFKTQFAKGFQYPDDSTIISNFLAPGYLIVSLGMDYKPFAGLSIFLTPISGKTIFVYDTLLADKGKYIPCLLYTSEAETV